MTRRQTAWSDRAMDETATYENGLTQLRIRNRVSPTVHLIHADPNPQGKIRPLCIPYLVGDRAMPTSAAKPTCGRCLAAQAARAARS